MKLVYIEIPYLLFVILIAIILPFAFPILQSICIVLIVVGAAISTLGFSYFFGKASVDAIKNTYKKSFLLNTINLLAGVASKLSGKVLDGRSRVDILHFHYFVFGIALLSLGLLTTFILATLHLI